MSNVFANQWIKGIYLTQITAENSKRLCRLIQAAKLYGINTFVIDCKRDSRAYRKNISLVKQNNIRYVARIVIFPHGGTNEQILSKKYWEKKYRLAELAIQSGADEIQLDYIRYRSSQKPSPQNAENIHEVIKWFKQKLNAQNIPLQIDVFGVASFGHSMHIGHNLKLFGETVDAICPMVYPSHYEPYRKYAKIPYQTIISSLRALHAQFNHDTPCKIYPYIELSNYRYPLTYQQRLHYIYRQLKAVEDGDVNGWFAWSPNNKYRILFKVLQLHKRQIKELAENRISKYLEQIQVKTSIGKILTSIAANPSASYDRFNWSIVHICSVLNFPTDNRRNSAT